MTERTLRDVDRDIRAVHKKLEARSVIIGPVWNRAVLSFQVDDGIDDEPYTDWSEQFDKYQKGETIGEVVASIEPTGSDRVVYIDFDTFFKIAQGRSDVRINEARELQRLRQERHKLREIQKAERELSKLKGEEQPKPQRNTMSAIDQILEDC